MAPVASTVDMAMSHLEGVSDGTRARELYKYYQPSAPTNQDVCFPESTPISIPRQSERDDSPDVKIRSDVTASKIASPDHALTAFCQLTAWRTGAQRAMLSVIDGHTQYFLAESTKTVDFTDNTRHAPGDAIWMGCTAVTKAGRLCERTIAVAPTKPGSYPCFIVNDLTQDERFNTLPFVTGSPFLKFYAGVPLITKRGVPIGSLFIVDNRPHLPMEDEKIRFMSTMAGTVMRHMEMVREVEEHRRGMKMSRGLASFVEGRSELAEAETDADEIEGQGTKIVGQFEAPTSLRTHSTKGSTAGSFTSATGSIKSIDRKAKEYSAALTNAERSILATNELSESPLGRPDLEGISHSTSYEDTNASISDPSPMDKISTRAGEDLSETSVMKLLFARSANLIREAFEIDGGAVFYDAQTGFSSNFNRHVPEDSSAQEDSHIDSAADSHLSGDDASPAGETALESEKPPPSLLPAGSNSPGLGESSYTRTMSVNDKLCEILGFSTTESSSIHGDPLPGPSSFTPFAEKSLHVLLRRYPRGKLWTFDSDGAVSSSSEEDLKPIATDPIQRSKDAHRRRSRSKKTKSDANFLSQKFAGVRQLLFVPLWDASRSRWLSGCFVWSTEATRILSRQNELAFLTAFGNSVMAEWARIDLNIADQKKSDFIGSISHELRSPLHGILASAEFLAETSSGWSKGLVETIDSCGRTLLDTINHILDYSKINHFEKNWRRSKRADRRSNRRGSSGALALRQSDLPMLNLYQNIDIAILCEEVVESVFAGHVFQNVTAQSFDMVPGTRGKMSDAGKSTSGETVVMQSPFQPGVVVILDVDIQNYCYNTQPGALRRLVMNLLGNALKYTSHGYVYIKLEATEIDDYNASSTSPPSESVPRSMITLTVSDTGKGISAEFLRSKLFTPFAQENSLSSGTGLGLSIVKKIVSLLEGDIRFDSEVGRGTQVRVTLPLLREMPSTGESTSSSSTHKSLVAATRDADQSIQQLRLRVVGQKVALHGFDINTQDPILRDMYRILKSSVINCLVHWYGMKVVPLGQKASLIVCNEGTPDSLQVLVSQLPKQKGSPSIVVLCAHDTIFSHTPHLEDSTSNVGYVAKPVGPLKLAKAITSCLDGFPPSATPGIDSSLAHHSTENNDLSSTFDSLTMSPQGGEILDNSRMSADSVNARKALESPTPSATQNTISEFPFPNPPIPEEPEHPIPSLKPPKPTFITHPSSNPLSATTNKTSPSKPTKISKPTLPLISSPTFLLVDDNQINMKLLSTYIRRRNFEIVHEAVNGLEAVMAVKGREKGYDIIFMDITMPVMDGFEATRQIRALENARRDRDERVLGVSGVQGEARAGGKAGGEERAVAGSLRDSEGGHGGGRKALIIAFTGRSSMEDQSESVRVGLDLFMTKPVSLKEVGKIIDNWRANEGKFGGEE